ncbi:MAG: Xaa-Pro dipeptidase, partial [Deltaproteobacteria bacterium]|nr:Xaa-Pro dipeptidase [Deltaproteobacteria bacterium]
EAIVNYEFRRRGGTGPGYASIIGAGENATILHYTENRSQIADGDLVLVDAGCEYGHYTSDITRTWPANGTFTPAQRRVYEIVLAAQRGAIELAVPGTMVDQLHHHCVRALTAGMIELGLLEGPVEARVEDGTYRQFYMHGTVHWLGLDVHDVGAYTRDGTSRPLETGMVITVEPGLYIARDAPNVPAELRGIGIRIEDDVAITEGRPEVLTAACPKDVADIEAACRGAARS